MTFDFLTVMYKGKRLDYDGIFMKRRNSPGADQFLFVAAGQTVSSTFDISAGYDVSKSGKYSVAFRIYDVSKSGKYSVAFRIYTG